MAAMAQFKVCANLKQVLIAISHGNDPGLCLQLKLWILWPRALQFDNIRDGALTMNLARVPCVSVAKDLKRVRHLVVGKAALVANTYHALSSSMRPGDTE